MIIPKSVKPGMSFIVSEKAELTAGNRLPLRNIPVGTFVYNIEINQEVAQRLVVLRGFLRKLWQMPMVIQI